MERDATINAERAPDWLRDRFRRPLLEMRLARMTPRNVLMMSAAGTVGIADIRGDAWREVEVCCCVLAMVEGLAPTSCSIGRCPILFE